MVLDQWWRQERELPAAHITSGDLVKVNGVWYEIAVRYTTSDGMIHVQSRPMNTAPPQIDLDLSPETVMAVRKQRAPDPATA